MTIWRGQTQEERFWSNVEQRGGEECWPWRGKPNGSGYGRVRFDGVSQRAHRVSYQLAHRVPIPDGLEVAHSCDNPICVNPSHLDVRTHAENMAEITDKGRRKRKLTDAQICAIHASKELARHIAPRYGISEGYVYVIRRHYIPGSPRSYPQN